MAVDVFADVEHRMKSAIEALQRELNTIRTGRASPTLLERLMVDYYGTPTPVQQIASIHAPDARMLTIQPYDKSTLSDIEKAIQKSDLGLNPTNDGQMIRLVLPPLTEDRRKELVKVAHKKVDEAKVAVRNCRRDAHDTLREQEKSKEISADDLKRSVDRLQKLTDRYTGELEKVGQAKEQEILSV
ncbi:MAG TPA: ribosome recycling factor [Ktedonobacterales bacterium]|jgi:ribosome recycling factor|nr:ribosome recycling factor [Ktedonobacterales bacterium]